MKKLIVLTLLFLSVNTFSQIVWKNTKSININYGNGYIGWTSCQANVKFDFDRDVIVIYTEKLQIFNILSGTTTLTNNYRLFKGIANDEDYHSCNFEIYFYNSGKMILKLIYSNIIYKYEIM